MKEWHERVLHVIQKKNGSLLAVAGIAFVAGAILLLFRSEILLLRGIPGRSSMTVASVCPTQKKMACLSFFKHGAFKMEEQELLWGNHVQENIRYLISAMLSVWEDEQVTQKKVSLQSVIVSPSGKTAYLSFDRVPFDKDASTFCKWHTIEALLKTLRDNDVGIRDVYFLVHHELLVDSHLDFSNPWTISGFLHV